MGLCRRLHWPDDFQRLAADRKQKGFNVVQIVAGLYPDMPAFDPRGANEAGFPWEKDYARIRPEYFDQADRRFQYLADEGFVPCIVGAWGYHLPWLGIERMKKHWRYLVARYGALPVVWCAAGEGTMPFYRSEKPNEDAALQKQGWTAVIRSIRSTDPFGRIITIHPGGSARDTVADPAVLDFDMHQTGHGPEAMIGADGPADPDRLRRAARHAGNRGRVELRRAGSAGVGRRRALQRRLAADVLDRPDAQRRGWRHLRRQWHLAGQPPRGTLRAIAARAKLGQHPLGRIHEAGRFDPGGLGQEAFHAI